MGKFHYRNDGFASGDLIFSKKEKNLGLIKKKLKPKLWTLRISMIVNGGLQLWIPTQYSSTPTNPFPSVEYSRS